MSGDDYEKEMEAFYATHPDKKPKTADQIKLSGDELRLAHCSVYVPHGGIGSYCARKPKWRLGDKLYCTYHLPNRVKERDDNLDELGILPLGVEYFLNGCPLIRRTCVNDARLFTLAENDEDAAYCQRVRAAGYQIDHDESLALAKEHLILFLRKINHGKTGSAARHLQVAIDFYPQWLQL